MIREMEPPKPSTKISSLGEDSQEYAKNRHTDVVSLRRRLQRELDWIVMKTLEKDRARRYATAMALAEDVGHYLQHEPVQAGPPNSWYRMRKHARRYRMPLAVAASFAALLVAITILAVRGYYREASLRADTEREAHRAQANFEIAQQSAKEAKVRAEGERLAKLDAQAKQAEAERQKARAEAETRRADEERRIAQTVRDFLQTKLLGQANVREQADSLLRSGSSSAAAKLNPTIRELLDRAALELAPDTIETNFPKQPLLQAEILRTVGNTYGGVGEYQRSIGFLQRTVALYRAKLGPDHPLTLSTMIELAEAYESSGRVDLALELLEKTVNLMRTKLGPSHPETLTGMNILAIAYGNAGKRDAAFPLFHETLNLRKAKLGNDHPDTLASMSNLAAAYYAAGKPNLALPLFEESHRRMKVKLGDAHPDTLTCTNNLAIAYASAGRPNQALPLFEETLKVMKQKFGADHPSTLASMNNLASAYLATGRPDLALPSCEEALKLRQAKLGPHHPSTLASMGNLARVYQAVGKPALALPLLQETLDFKKAKLGNDHPETLAAMNNLAAAYWRLKRLDRSIPLLEETLTRKTATFGPQHPSTLSTAADLGVNCKDAGRVAEALPLLEQAYRAKENTPALRWVAVPLLDAYARAAKTEQAAALVGEILAQMQMQSPRQSFQLAGPLEETASSLLQAKVYREAESLLRECLAIREKTEPEAWTTFDAKSMLGGALLGQKKHAQAEPLLLAGYEGMKQREANIPPASKVHVDKAIERLIQLAKAMGKKQDETKWQTELNARKKSAR
jgi:eukaryotic-like serine/threonine-protein kinase